jgi:antitoxin component YwqK of YwqJK toxin-antitoxin module
LKTGKWTTWSENGILEETGNYKLDKLNGQWKFYYETGGLKSIVHYKMGKLSGKTTNYFITGEKQGIMRHKLIKQKEYVLTKANGKKVYKTRYVSKPHGKWVYYDTDGKVLFEQKYKKGEKVD